MSATTIHVDAVLFDMDGTLVDSTAGVVGAWETFAKSYPGSHGVRTVENLRKYCGITDEAELEKEAQRFEQAIVDSSKNDGRTGITMLPGVRAIMDEILPGKDLPNPCWAICTSATRVYASAALEVANIAVPDAFVVAEDVKQGKPHPDPYLLGAKKCGVSPERCLVVEDAPAGVLSGHAAGCQVLGLVTTHSREKMETCNPEYLVKNLSSVSMRRTDKGVEVTIFKD
ncbi:HAD-like protein [Leucogyrophana mollusca]|uniref:HAD-like protein n=1 Tax=Leucogyrophana mollusca TaxID=85980 RepID=A0ACB8BZM4_9AGAM|nr:HAD-like protein [Leucogyrophana mollusca]